MIHVCFGVYDKDGRYSKFAGTAIASIFDNTTSEVTVHILHDNTMTLANYEKFVYHVEKICADKIADFQKKFFYKDTSKFTIGIMYRLLVINVLEKAIEKIIYLDSDIIVNLDIKKLWKIELGDKFIAAAAESEGTGIPAKNYLAMCRDGIVADDEYFNSGVLLINLEKLRQEESAVMRGIEFIAEHPQYINFDQDVLNYCFSKKFLKLTRNFNRFVVHSRRESDGQTDERILHYISTSQGLGVSLNLRDPFNRLWFKYFEKTPWFNAESIGHIYEGVRQIQHELQSRTIWMSKVMAGRQRAFFVPPNNLEPMKKVFGVDDNDEIILAIGMESLQQLIDSMKKSKGAKLYFILTAQFPGVQATLTREGFKDGRDFVNGLIFLSEAHGVPMNSYPLIKAL